MKITKIKIFIFLLISVVIKSQKNLFETVANEIDYSDNKNVNKNKKSLFDSVPLNFNQVSEKIKKESKTESQSLFSAMKTNQNSPVTTKANLNTKPNNQVSPRVSVPNGPIPQKPIGPLPSQIQTRVNVLLELNSKLVKKIKNKKTINQKNKKLSSNIVSFIQKNQMKVVQMKKQIEDTENKISQSLNLSESEIFSIGEELKNNFQILQSKLNSLKEKMNKLKKSNIHFNKQKINLNDLRVNEKFTVNGNSFIKKISTKSIEFEHIKISDSYMRIDSGNTKIIVKNKILNLTDLEINLKYLNRIQQKCGMNFSQCVMMTSKELLEKQKEQENILESLKLLRQETKEALSK